MEKKASLGTMPAGEQSKIRLAAIRKGAGVSQAELAREFGVAQNTISQWENGLREIEFKYIRALCAYFKVSADYLLGVEPCWDDELFNRYAAANNARRAEILAMHGCPSGAAFDMPSLLPKASEDNKALLSSVEIFKSRPELFEVFYMLMAKSLNEFSNMMRQEKSAKDGEI